MSASVSDVQFEARVRVVMKPLVGLMPIVGGIQECNSMLFLLSYMSVRSQIYHKFEPFFPGSEIIGGWVETPEKVTQPPKNANFQKLFQS